MHKTNQELLDTINHNTDNAIPSTSHCIPLYAHGEISSITCLEPVVNNSCCIHTWVKNPSTNWLTRDYIRTVYGYAFDHCNTIVARVPKNNARATRYAISTGFTLCYTTEHYDCYTYTREQYVARFSSLYHSCVPS
jgi:hypothetical protein